YQMAVFPLGGGQVTKEWVNSTDNNIEFGKPYQDVLAVCIAMEEGTHYVVLANHGEEAVTASWRLDFSVDGAYLLSRYDDPSGKSAHSTIAQVSGGAYVLDFELGPDDIVLYQFNFQN